MGTLASSICGTRRFDARTLVASRRRARVSCQQTGKFVVNARATRNNAPRRTKLVEGDKWTHWDLNPGPSACGADVMPLHHAPDGRSHGQAFEPALRFLLSSSLTLAVNRLVKPGLGVDRFGHASIIQQTRSCLLSCQYNHQPWGSNRRPQGEWPCPLPTELGRLLIGSRARSVRLRQAICARIVQLHQIIRHWRARKASFCGPQVKRWKTCCHRMHNRAIAETTATQQGRQQPALGT